MSPEVTSWGKVELTPGEYAVLDFLPDFANEDGLNLDKGMYKFISVQD